MDSFLQQVATYLDGALRHQFKDMVLVFPNQRSIAYFNDALKNQVSDTVWLPKTVTIAEFLESHASFVKGSQVNLLFELYLVYVEVSNSKETFDDFFHWGEILLNDFDDVDKYMAEPKAVFANVKDARSMERSLEFLTEEQIQVLEAFFKSFDVEKYSALQKSFFEVWEVLVDIYEKFNKNLHAKQISYEGAIYKGAVDYFEDHSVFDFEKVVFIGFNAITKCEERIFSLLQNKKKALFFWDYDEFYVRDFQQEAGLFVRNFIKQFPMPSDFNLKSQLLDKNRVVTVYSAPTNHGQIELAGRKLQSLTTSDQSKVALVLADEGMLFPVLNNLPENIGFVNTTMGYPVMESTVGTLIDLIIQLQQSSRASSKGELSFYYKYVVRILRHPMLQKYDGSANDLIVEIVDNNWYYVPQSKLQGTVLQKLIFNLIDDFSSFHVYLSGILKELIAFVLGDSDADPLQAFNLEFLYAAFKCNNQLFDELYGAKIKILLPTYFQLLLKLLKTNKVPFEGEPMKGLQLMGFLETRNLDFEEVFILSVNEGLLPSNQHRSSFIPYSLRKGFGLPTSEMHDAMYAYYFYRMLQRSKKVHLIYNSGASGMKGGEKSRFIQQLIYGDAFEIKEEVIGQSLTLQMQNKQVIKKGEPIRKVLDAYIEDGSMLRLSPSAISRYLQCQIKFFYHTVLKVYEQDEVDEHVDARLFGNLFHVASEYLYGAVYRDKILVDAEYMKRMMTDEMINQSVQFAFNEVFKVKSKKNFKIEGKNVLVQSVLCNYLKQLLAKDKEVVPFSVVGIEEELNERISFNVEGKLVKVLVGGLVDRIDRTSNALRIVDYKTGADKLVFKHLEDVFDAEKIKDHKAILQTFIYSLVYALKNPNEPVIVPMVYQVKEFFVPQSSFGVKSTEEPKFAGGNFKGVQEEVSVRLAKLLEEIFDYSLPFVETKDEKQCEYCSYRLMCGK